MIRASARCGQDNEGAARLSRPEESVRTQVIFPRLRHAVALAFAALTVACGSTPKSDDAGPVASTHAALFSNSTPWVTWDPSYDHKYADVNGDGKADIIGVGPGTDIMVALSTGTSFAGGTVWQYWSSAYDHQFADVSGDGMADAIGTSGADVVVALSNGVSFPGPALSWVSWSPTYDHHFADVNGDRKADIIGVGPSGDVMVALSTGTSFGAGAVWQLWSSDYSHHFADVNGDGKADIIGRSGPTVVVALSNGSSFVGPAVPWASWPVDFDTRLADVNGDGMADLVGVAFQTDVQVRLSTGSSFAPATKWTTWFNGYDHEFADFDGHGEADIVGVSGWTVRVGLTIGPSQAGPPAPGWISAFGGVGTRGWSPSGTPALSAKLDSPSGLALCPDGALYVSDTGNNRVVKFSGGQMTVAVAGQTAPNGQTYGNLLVNPRAETPIEPSSLVGGWVTQLGRWYEVESGQGQPEPLDGEHYFQAAPGSVAQMYQDVNVSAYAAAIDGGTQWFNFSGFVRSRSEGSQPADAATIVVQYLSAGNVALATYTSGLQQWTAEWTLLSDTRAVPTGTRTVRVRLTATRKTGVGNDVYFDGLLLRALPNPSGQLIVDGGPAINATLSQPHGLACDTDGTLYIADTYNGLVRSVDPSGMIHTVAGRKTAATTDVPLPPSIGEGDGVATNIPLRFPVSVAINHASGNADASWLKLVVADLLAHKVRAITTAGNFRTVLSGNGAPCSSATLPGTDACVYYPSAVDAVGNLMGAPHVTVAGQGTRKLLDNLFLNPAGSGPAANYFPITQGPGFSDALDFNGLSSASGLTMRRAVAVTSVAADPSPAPADPHLVRSHFIGALKNTDEAIPSIFVADLSNHAIRHVTVDGLVQTVAGNGTIGDSGDGGPAGQALLSAPSALAQSKDGTLYIADAETNRIRKISCADADRCSSNVTLNGPSCVWTPAPPLNDGNSCTDDRCSWPTGVMHLASTALSCSDGNPCNGNEMCSGGACVAGPPLASGASCSDSNACNGAELCAADHTCQPGVLPPTDDFNPCTADTCSLSGGVTHVSVPNNTICLSNDPCRNPGTCQAGSCITTPIALNTTSNPCVTETCSSTAGVVRTFNSGDCQGGTCSGGACIPTVGFGSSGTIDNTVPSSPGALFAAIYVSGVQTGASPGTDPGQLNPDHAAHLFGTVALSDAASPLGVTVVVLNHPESGQTLVRADGKFDIVANGGAPLVLRFTKAGYLPVDRRAAPIWGAGAHIDDVVMVKLDAPASVRAWPSGATSTSVALNSNTFQEATGSTITATMDRRGERTARVLFPPNTTATAISLAGANGTTTTLTGGITVRATEFTVGTSAEALSRMPAALPATTLYTYAVDFTVDEAPNAASVEFNQPVFVYLENFIGTRTGDNVPDGFYDRDKAAWVPEHNGKALDVVGYNADGAVIDITGDGAETQADTDAWNSTTPANERLTANDRALIALRYPDGTPASPKRIWRVPLTHFSVHDFNHGGGVECVGTKCPEFASAISGGADAPEDPCELSGSIIGAEEQSLGEQLPIMGTPFALNYKSSYTLGYLPPRGVEVDYQPRPTTLDPKEFRVSLATSGGSWSQIKPAPRQNYISWDGLDGAGRRVNGSQLATIQATQVYSGSYKATGLFGNAAASDSVSSGYPVVAGVAPDVLYTRTFTKTLSAWGADTLGLGGWTLSSMHVYDPTSGVLYQGDGTQRNSAGGRVLQLIAGNGTGTSAPSETPAVNSGIPVAEHQPTLAVASNGDVYFAFLKVSPLSPWREVVLRKVVATTGNVVDVLVLPSDSTNNGSPYDVGVAMAFSPDGQFLYIPTRTQLLRVDVAEKKATVFAGTGVGLAFIDGPADHATFGQLGGIAVAQDGTIYVADTYLVRKIAMDKAHTVSTVAGSRSANSICNPGGSSNGDANGKPAKEVMLGGFGSVHFGLSVAPDGTLWIGTGYDLIRVDAAGLAWCRTERTDALPSDRARVDSAVAVAADGTVYFGSYADFPSNKYSLRTYNPDGTSVIVAGGGVAGEPTDGASAINSPIGVVFSMSPGPDGSLYFFNWYANAARIYRLTAPPKTSSADCAIALSSEDGSQKFCFDKNGRHLSTRNARTGESLLSFNYIDGRLKSVHDDVDNTDTTIERTSDLVTITSHFGQTTTIKLDPTTQYAMYIEDATHQRTNVTHDRNGLLRSMTDRNGKLHSFAYDSLGRLMKDADPVGFQSLQRTATLNGVAVVPTTAKVDEPVSGPIVADGYSVSDTSAMGAARSFALKVDPTGGETRTVTLADGTKNESVRNRKGDATIKFGDGRTVTTTTAIDPTSRLPYDNFVQTEFPSHLKSVVTRNQSLVGTVSTDNVSLNGAAFLTKSFDSNTKTHTITSPGGRSSTITVDAHNRPRTVTPATGINDITYHYDHGRLDSVSQGARQTQLFYYAAGTNTPGHLQRIKVTDSGGAISTLIEPDNAGRPLRSTTCTMNPAETACASDAVETDLGWDSEGNLKSVTPPWMTPPGKQVHNQTYTGTNLLDSYIPPAVPDVADPKTSFFYNRDGALEYVQQPGNRYIDYQVEPTTGHLLDDGNATFKYYSSSASTGSTQGRLQTATTATVSQSFTYDGPLPTGEATTWLDSSSSSSAGITRGFNADLRLQTEQVSITPHSGSTIASKTTYGYDADGLLKCAAVAACASPSTCASFSTCDPVASNTLALSYSATTGAITGTTFGATLASAVSDLYTPNAYGELASYSAKVGTSPPFYSVTYDDLSTQHARDGFGRVKRETVQNDAVRVREYAYDEQGRLARVSDDIGTLLRHYTYDFNGNRLSTSASTTTAIAAYDAQDRLTSYEGTTYKYWPNGELRSKRTADGGVTEYNYAPLGYLTGGTLPSGMTFSYAYDGFGRRIQKVGGSVTTRYVYRDGLHPVAVLDGNGALLSRFIYGSHANVPDVMVLADGTTFRIASDQLGSPRAVVVTSGPTAGTVVKRIDYDEFGNRAITKDTGAFAARALPFGFAGGLYDEDTGLVHFGARDYDPRVGRWISKDPALFGGGQANLYTYVGNDPINFVDPTGLYWIDANGARNWDEWETQRILADQIAAFASSSRFGVCGEAFTEGGFYGGKFDFKFSPFFKGDYFWVPGVGRMNAATFGNYFAGYVYQTALKGNAFPDAGRDLALWGGRFTKPGGIDDANSVEAINRGASDADAYFRAHPWPGAGSN